MPTQLVQLALIDPQAYIDSGVESDLDIEKFSIFQEGAQDASRQVVSIEPNIIVLEGGSELIESKTYAIDVAGLYNQAKRTKLAGWSKNRTPLWISGYGLDGHILYGYGAITSYVGTGTNMSFKFRMQNDAKGGYGAATSEYKSEHSAGFIYSSNGACYTKWESREGLPNLRPYWYNGWNILGVDPLGSLDTGEELEVSDPTYSFSGGGFRVQTDSDDRVWLYRSLFFPFDNVELHFTTKISSYTQSGTPVASCDIYYMTDDFDDLNNRGSVNITGTGDFTASITTGIGTKVVKIRHGIREDIDVVFEEPRLNIGEVKPFIEFNT